VTVLKKLLYVAAMGTLAIATTSFGENFQNPYLNHGGFTAPGFNQFQNPYQRPTAPGGMGGGTIANGGGSGFNQFQNPYQSQNQNLFNPYFQPYLNTAPWGQYSPYQNQWNTPWTSTWNNGMGSNMMSPYYGNQFQSPYSSYNPYQYGSYNSQLPWQYNNGIPGLGYNTGGLGSSNFYDWGLGGYGYNDFSPYLGNNNSFNYDPYGMGLGYGNYTSPYDYSSGYGGGYDPFWSDVGFGDDLGSWWY
jgi:hypothetical protein